MSCPVSFFFGITNAKPAFWIWILQLNSDSFDCLDAPDDVSAYLGSEVSGIDNFKLNSRKKAFYWINYLYGN